MQKLESKTWLRTPTEPYNSKVRNEFFNGEMCCVVCMTHIGALLSTGCTGLTVKNEMRGGGVNERLHVTSAFLL